MKNQSNGVSVKAFFRSAVLLKLRESFISVLPIVAVVSVLFFTNVIDGFYLPAYLAFCICSALIVIGLGLFNLGTESSMSRIGVAVGESLFKKKKIFFIVAMTFVVGVIVTIAEPDLAVLSSQIGINRFLLIVIIAIGVGLFIVFGVLRIIFNKNLNIMFICFYGIVFMLAGIVNPKFLPICFDSGGVTTGPVTVPFILAFGAGLAASTSSRGRNNDDSFGLTALASVGPILAVMVLSLFLDVDSLVYTFSLSDIASYSEVGQDFWLALFELNKTAVFGELAAVGLAITPIMVFYLVYNALFIKARRKAIIKVVINMLYAYLGLVTFLTAVNVGFMPVAQLVGKGLAAPDLFPLAVVVGLLFGVFGVFAEPAVHVLVRQVEMVSEGTIKSFSVMIVMALSVGGGVALAVVRAHFGFPILYYMIPGYFIALGLSFLVPKIYTAMAFDSGGVASGPMASTFVVPFVIGFTAFDVGADKVFENAFGAVAMIALMPLIVIQLMGLYAGVKRKAVNALVRKKFMEDDDLVIIDFEEGHV